jgi:uncharacterized membrane protein
MKQALWQLFSDLLSAILFLICFALTGDVRIAAGVAVAAGLAQIGWLKFAGRGRDAIRRLSDDRAPSVGAAGSLEPYRRPNPAAWAKP